MGDLGRGGKETVIVTDIHVADCRKFRSTLR